MDDQQGNVIDGTARARQWRGSRSNSRAGAEETEPRSDAPKSIASSLLVPAEMVHEVAPPTVGDEAHRGGQPKVASEARDPAAHAPSGATIEGTDHQNPFLASEFTGIATTGALTRYSRRRSISVWATRLVSGVGSRISELRDHRHLLAATPRRRRRAPRMARTALLALSFVAAVATGAEVVIQTQSGSAPLARSNASGTNPASLDRLKSALLPSVTNPFAGEQPAHRSRTNHARRGRTNRATNRHPRTRPARSTTAAAVRYTAPSTEASAPPSSTSPSSGYLSLGSTPAPAAQPAAQPSTASSKPTQPYGPAGALGPGSSPNG